MTAFGKILTFVASVFVLVPLGSVLTFVLGLTNLENVVIFWKEWVAQFGIVVGLGGIMLGYYLGFHRFDHGQSSRTTEMAFKEFANQVLGDGKDVDLTEVQVVALRRHLEEWIQPEESAIRVSEAYVKVLKETFEKAI